LFPTHKERFNRDFDNVKKLIEASALLHQYQRQTDEQGRIVATEKDYELVFSLGELITESMSTISQKLHSILETIEYFNRENKNPTKREITDALKISDKTLERQPKNS
jgi:thiamine monophosphate kinase